VPGAPKPVAFLTARIGGAVLTGFAFAGMVAIFVAMTVDAMHLDRVGIVHARWLFMVVLSSVPLFAAHGASTSFLDAYAQGKFYLPPSAAGHTGGGTTANPWHNALLAGCVVGLPITILSYALIPRLWPQDGFSPSGFSALIAASSGVLAAAVMFAWTGRAFLREVAVPAQRRQFHGSLKSYIWQRHVIPQFLINAWFNAWAALSLVHGPVSDPNSSMSRGSLLIDAFVSPLGLAFGIAAGTRAYASFDLRWGVMAAQPARARGSMRPAWLMLGGALGTGLVIALVLFALGIEQVHTWPLVAARGLLCGAYCGAIAFWNVHWTLCSAEPIPATSMTASPPIAATPDVAITTDPAS
jgi:hypothetical protein